MRQVRRRADLDGSLTVFVAVDGEPAGAFLLEDPIRPDAPRMVRALRDAGISRVVLVTGDRADIADMVGRIVGVDAVLADCDPADKLAAIERESAHGRDDHGRRRRQRRPRARRRRRRGGARRARRDRVVRGRRRRAHRRPGRRPGRRDPHRPPLASGSRCRPSWSAWGCRWSRWSPPPSGCSRRRPARSLQEVIDVLAIGIALRAVLPGAVHTIAMPAEDIATARPLRAEHDATLPLIEQIRSVADGLSTHDR